MGHRLSKIYTRTGDGTTGRWLTRAETHARTGVRHGRRSEQRDRRDPRGTGPAAQNEALTQIQHELFDPAASSRYRLSRDQDSHIDQLEQCLDRFNEPLPPLKEFILPGGGPAAAACHVARAITRRAERNAWALAQSEEVAPQVTRYLNRLSDLLFVVARVLARHENGQEVLWKRR
jgi:cob(I)alamin adenosyltransferase